MDSSLQVKKKSIKRLALHYLGQNLSLVSVKIQFVKIADS